MNIIWFIHELNKINFGIVSFNTYQLNNENCFYLMVAERGNFGKFFKTEGNIDIMNDLLNDLLKEILLQIN